MSRAKKIKYFLLEAKYYNNARQYKKAARQINLALSIWDCYKHPDSKKAKKMLAKIDNAIDIVIHNYTVKKQKEIESMFDI